MLLRHDILTHRRLADVYRYLVMVGNVAQSGAENVYLLFVLLEFLFLLYVLVVLLDKNSHDAQPKISRVTPAKPMTPGFGCQVATRLWVPGGWCLRGRRDSFCEW